jgi:hypothetical protein
MAQQTTMTLYQEIVLECQRCYTICRYTDAARRRNCPACGLAIANWEALVEMVHQHVQQAEQHPTPAEPDRGRG